MKGEPILEVEQVGKTQQSLTELPLSVLQFEHA